MLKPATIAAATLLGASLAAAPAQAADFFSGWSLGTFRPTPFLTGPVAGAVDQAPQDPDARLAEYVAAVNDYRADAGLGAVTESADLNAQAQEWANHLAATGELEHSTVSCTSAGLCEAENIATAGVAAAPRQTVSRWFDSEGHRANLLRGNTVQVGHGEAVYTTGPWAGHLIVVERFYSHY